MPYKPNMLLVLLLLVMAGCSKLPLYESDWKANMDEHRQAAYRFYDPDTRVRYRISNNDSMLFISVSTEQPTSKQQLLISGLKTYMDTTHKKSKAVYLYYPQPMPPEQKANLQGEEQPLMKIAERYDGRALFVYGEEQRPFNAKLNDTDFKLYLEDVDQYELAIHMAIPFSRIYPDGVPDNGSVTIGFASERPGEDKKLSGPRVGVSGGMGTSAGGLGTTTGMGQQGVYGSGMGTNRPSAPQVNRPQSNTVDTTPLVKIWVKVQLDKQPPPQY